MKTIFEFNNQKNYEYDDTLIQFTGGVATLKDLRPPEAIFFANYKNNINGTWGEGVLTGTPTGGASVSGGKLDLAHNDLRYVDYDAVLNADSQQKGTIIFELIPNYTGKPLTDQVFFSICKAGGDSTNLIQLYHNSGDGYVHILVKDETNTTIINTYLILFQPVAGNTYEFKLYYDFTAGNTYLAMKWVIGNLSYNSAIITNTLIRSSDIGLLRIGSSVIASTTSNFKIDKYGVLNNAMPDNFNINDLPETIYSITNPTIKTFLNTELNKLYNFENVINIVGLDNVKHILLINGIPTYYDILSATWKLSNAKYIESNTAAEILTNLPDLYIEKNSTLAILTFLHSDTGFTKPELDSITIEYNDEEDGQDIIKTTRVYGKIANIDNFTGLKIKITLSRDTVQYKTNTTVIKDTYIIKPDRYGNWYADLIENTNMKSEEGYRIGYYFTFGTQASYLRFVPAEVDNVAYYDLKEPK